MKKVKENWIFIIILIIGLLCQLRYVYSVTADVPIMDYWKYINMFVEKIYTNNVTVADIWQNDGIHRSPLQFIYFIFNVKFFCLDSRIEIYLGTILMAFTIILLYKYLKKDLLNINQKSCPILEGLALVVIIYNLNQYEILSEQFSLSFATRMLFFIISFAVTSRFLTQLVKADYKQAGLIGVFYVFVITCASGGYFPAYVATIIFAIVFDFVVKKDRKKYVGIYATLIIALLIGTGVYLAGIMQVVSATSSSQVGIYDFIKGFVVGIVTMTGVSIIGFEYSNVLTVNIGIVVVIAYIVSFVLYLKRQYYKKTYVPILMYGYSIGAMGLIYLGRVDLYGNSYAYASRYVYESKIALIGFLWIIALYCADMKSYLEKRRTSVIRQIISYASIIVLLLGIVNSGIKEWRIAPYRKIYMESLIEAMENVEILSTEEFAPFQSDEQTVRSGIELMKKYELGIYKKK